MADRPNILWICTDSQRWDSLGCTGNPFVRTPHLDRLARDGTRFECAIAQSPLCTPSRGSFLTGRYPVTNRLRQNGQNCPPDLLTLPRLLRDAGYVCGLAGKLHLSACDNRLLLGPEWWKEDERLWFRGAEPRIDDGYDVFHWDHEPSGKNPTSGYTQWLIAQGAPRDPRTPREDCSYVFRGRPEPLHQSTWCADRAIGFIEGVADSPHPWLFSVNFFDPHASFDPPDAYLERYLERLDEIPLPDYIPGELEEKPAAQRRQHAGERKYSWEKMTTRDHRMVRAAYWAMCDLIDVQVGRLLEALERTGQRENTLVLFTSDHGEMLGDRGLYIKGPFLYDAAVRVPLIVSWPGRVLKGRRVAAPVELADLAPTLLETAGGAPHPGMQGRSLLPLLRGEAEAVRSDAYCEYYNANPDRPAVYLTMVRTDRHKLVRVHGTEEGELYNLSDDPGETRNRWNDPAAATLKTEMLLRLCDRMAHTCDPLHPRIGVY